MYKSVNPATGETIEEFLDARSEDIDSALNRSNAAYLQWRVTSLQSRSDTLMRIAKTFQDRKTVLSEIAGLEMGKPFAQAQSEVNITSDIFEYYAKRGAQFMSDNRLDVADGGTAIIRKTPIGSLLGIMPWNFPYYQMARFVAPNLMLGNTIILKHAPNCPQCALAIERIIVECTSVSDIYINVFATNDQVQEIIADFRNRGVSFTGSDRAGSIVASVAGKYLKRCVLELGGSDAFIVLDTDNVDEVSRIAATGRMRNAGQSCISPKRFIVLDSLYDKFVSNLTNNVSSFVPGDPHDHSVTLGPMSSEAAATNLVEQVQDAARKGARVRIGGKRVHRAGAYVEPTVLTNVQPGMRAYNEELFGPVAVVYSAANRNAAIDLANASLYGLGSSVWSQDTNSARYVADRLDTGMVWINELPATRPYLPFGGVKRSGMGRELGQYGMDEFANKKLIREAAARS